MQGTLTDDQIIRAIRSIRFSPAAARYGRRIPSINSIALAAGISRMQVYRVANGEPLTKRVRRELCRALSCHDLNGERTEGRPASPGDPKTR